MLRDGEAFGIFPEGISHTRPELAPLETGAARIALQAAQEGVVVHVVPAGLSYRRRDRMRSRVLVQYGAPIAIDGSRADDPWGRAWAQDPARAARALTAAIDTALRAQTINAADFETLRVLDGVRRLYRPPERTLSLAEQTELMRRFVDGWERYRDDPEVRSLYGDVALYLEELRALSLSDRELLSALTWWEKALRVLRHVFFLGVLVPVSIPGVVIHLPVIGAAVAASRTLTDRGDVRATIQMVVVTLLTLGAYVALAAARSPPSAPAGMSCGPASSPSSTASSTPR